MHVQDLYGGVIPLHVIAKLEIVLFPYAGVAHSTSCGRRMWHIWHTVIKCHNTTLHSSVTGWLLCLAAARMRFVDKITEGLLSVAIWGSSFYVVGVAALVLELVKTDAQLCGQNSELFPIIPTASSSHIEGVVAWISLPTVPPRSFAVVTMPYNGNNALHCELLLSTVNNVDICRHCICLKFKILNGMLDDLFRSQWCSKYVVLVWMHFW